jgi:hypothetical protein
MTESKKGAPKPTPKGGRKGGTIFPRITLKQALEYSSKLVSKTHTGPQPASTILPGVFGAKGPNGQVRASALKQFDLLEGDPTAYQATSLAKLIEAAVPGEKQALVRRAFLSSKLFKLLFDTFHGDTVSAARIRQQALSLDVHPDSADECVELFSESAQTAGIATRDGDSITLVNVGEIGGAAAAEPAQGEVAGAAPDLATPDQPPSDEQVRLNDDSNQHQGDAPRHRAGINVNLTVDSSSDPDKLQKQLELLKKFGVI